MILAQADNESLRLFPEQASTLAAPIDGLALYLLLVSGFFGLLIFTLLLFFAVKYRRREGVTSGAATSGQLWLEIVWTAIPLGIAITIFAWSTHIYVRASQPPDDALEIYVLGKQWMWKLQHPEGPREINRLHIPVGQPVKLTMISQDVIHSFFVPQFRVKADVLPGRFRTLWFEPTRVGVYDIFCAEYCGTDHSEMIGEVVVMTPAEYASWLTGGEPGEPLAVTGQRLFNRLGCATCHAESSPRGPSLRGVFGSQVELRDGTTVVADESYLHESILEPARRVVAGYDPIMPTYRGQIEEEEILELTEYIKSLSAGESSADPAQEE